MPTVADAIAAYARDLELRNGDPANAKRVALRLSPALLATPVAKLRSQELRAWRDALAEVLQPSSVNRTGNALKAALNLAAEHDDPS
jgi:hypothetical protein